MNIDRLLPNLCTNDLAASKKFYTSLFALEVNYDSDWFVHLRSEGGQWELGLIAESHDIVPETARGQRSGFYLTFVVADVDDLFTKVQKLGYEVMQAPETTFYGQKRMLIVAPEGTVCDLSSPT